MRRKSYGQNYEIESSKQKKPCHNDDKALNKPNCLLTL